MLRLGTDMSCTLESCGHGIYTATTSHFKAQSDQKDVEKIYKWGARRSLKGLEHVLCMQEPNIQSSHCMVTPLHTPPTPGRPPPAKIYILKELNFEYL